MDEQAKHHREEMDKRKDEMKPLIEAVYNGAKGNSTLVSCFQPCDSSFEL